MLPHFVDQDFQDVIDELQRRGFRRSQHGLVRAALRVPLSRCSGRSTLPRHRTWNSARRSSPGTSWARSRRPAATARYVDSSVERVQVKVQGMTEGRHVVTCNGRPRAAASHRYVRRIRRGRSLSGLAAAVVPAPDDPGPRPAGLRHLGYLAGPVARRLHVSCRPPRRPVVRHFPGQCQRGGEPPGRAVLPVRPHARADGPAPCGASPRGAADPRPAPTAALLTDFATTAKTLLYFPNERRDSYGNELKPPKTMPELERATITGGWELEYEPSESSFDEMVGADGSYRPHCQPFVKQIESIGLPELRRRWEEGKHLIRENGVTYNVYGDPQGMDRPWELDPIPLLVSPSDAAVLEVGLVQRAKLLDLVLADLYGPQRLLARGALPAELVFGSHSFLRPCHNLRPRATAISISTRRTWDGCPTVRSASWRIGPRPLRAPATRWKTGSCWSRMLPEVFRDCRVQRLALFFRTVRETLRGLAPHNRDNPRIVLLTPGPYNETYFEHAYLARYLGYTLVEGSDLTVRDNRVYLKLLDGLQPVDVILRRRRRRLLRSAGAAPGFVFGCAGSGPGHPRGERRVGEPAGERPDRIARHPGLSARALPRVARRGVEGLLGPHLVVWRSGRRTVTFWRTCRGWSSNPPSRAAVAIPCSSRAAWTGRTERTLADRIRAHPNDFVGQEKLELSTTPAVAHPGLRSRASRCGRS